MKVFGGYYNQLKDRENPSYANPYIGKSQENEGCLEELERFGYDFPSNESGYRFYGSDLVERDYTADSRSSEEDDDEPESESDSEVKTPNPL